MKHQFRYIGIFFLASIFFAGCDYLEKMPDDMKTDDMIWSSSAQTKAYLYNVYSQVPERALQQDDPWEGISDEIDIPFNVYATYKINLGNWDPSTNLYKKWGSFYKGIRASFVFENNVDRCTELSIDEIRQFKAEVKFLRGFYYWYIIRQYGPAVLIKEVTATDEDWSLYARAPFDECVEYICQLMDEAEPDLPLTWNDDPTWLGKPTKIACKAVKAEVLLLAASPQWNGNAEYASFKNEDGTPLASTTYDENKWKKAAAAALDVINLAGASGVKLYKNNENGDSKGFSPYKSVRDAILKAWNCEVIFGRSQALAGQNGWAVHASPGPSSMGGLGVTQRLVDAFYMENGRTIDDPQSGYLETGFATTGDENWNPRNLNLTTDRIKMIADIRSGDSWGHFPGDWNMYANREARFYANILYNKRIIPQISDDAAKRDVNSSGGQKNGYGRVEFYLGGAAHPGGSIYYPRSGYLPLKYVDPMCRMEDKRYYVTPQCEIFIRYAKVLLNYIESLNEYDPNHSDIALYWDMIRERAGLPGIFDTYPEIRGDKAKQRELIIRERQIELCFETDRYFTTRRRWLSHTPDSGDGDRKYGDGGRMWGMSAEAGSVTGNNFDFTGFYKRTSFETRVFDKKMYLFPIPQSEIEKGKSLVQNPWW